MSLLRKHPDPAVDALRRRIVACVRPGAARLDELLTTLDFEVSTAISSAALVDDGRPTLVVNPEFVARYCATAERLFVLVLHEYLHLVLGHTRLFGRVTPHKNLAFDAVINAMIAAMYPAPEFLALLREANSWQTFPGRLLRPPPGWPERPEPLPDDACEQERALHRRLYGTKDDRATITYAEVFELLAELLERRGAPDAADQASGLPPVVLLGGHDRDGGGAAIGAGTGEEAREAAILANADVRAILAKVALDATAGSPLQRELRRLGDPVLLQRINLAGNAERNANLERAIAEFFCAAGVGKPGRLRLRRLALNARETFGVLPDLGDRRAAARLAHGGLPPTFWQASTRYPATERCRQPMAFVYLDLSGSMQPYLRYLLPALTKPIREGVARLFAFSTGVFEVDPRRFGTQATFTTGGTSIAAVLRHTLDLPKSQRPKRIAVVTDGLVGSVSPALREAWFASGIQLHAALASAFCRDMQRLGARCTMLPSPRGGVGR